MAQTLVGVGVEEELSGDEQEGGVEFEVLGNKVSAEVEVEEQKSLIGQESKSGYIRRFFSRKGLDQLLERDKNHDFAMNMLSWSHVLLFIGMPVFFGLIAMDQSSMTPVIKNPKVFAIAYTAALGFLWLIAILGIVIPKLMGRYFVHHATNWSFRTACYFLLLAIFIVNLVHWWVYYAFYGNDNPHNFINLLNLIDYNRVTMIGTISFPYVAMCCVGLSFAFGEPLRDAFKKGYLV